MTKRLFSYKLTHDTGFAPNPFHGRLTLATCKPQIRRCKRVGDWIAGFTSKALCGAAVGEERLLYAMRVSEKILLRDYFYAEHYQAKKVVHDAADCIQRAGDNIYMPLTAGATVYTDFAQLENKNHWDHRADQPSEFDWKRDVSGQYVLCAEEFWYFGKEAIAVPAEVRPELPKGQSAHGKRTQSQTRIEKLIGHLREQYSVGIHGRPHSWPENDWSWQS